MTTLQQAPELRDKLHFGLNNSGSPAIDTGVHKWIEHTVYISYAILFNPSPAK